MNNNRTESACVSPSTIGGRKLTSKAFRSQNRSRLTGFINVVGKMVRIIPISNQYRRTESNHDFSQAKTSSSRQKRPQQNQSSKQAHGIAVPGHAGYRYFSDKTSPGRERKAERVSGIIQPPYKRFKGARHEHRQERGQNRFWPAADGLSLR